MMSDPSSEKVKKHINELPEMMMALMELFVTNKDYNARARLRLQMKSLLDFASADTVYPTQPEPKAGAGAQGFMADGYGRLDDGDVIPGARPERENEAVLGRGENA